MSTGRALLILGLTVAGCWLLDKAIARYSLMKDQRATWIERGPDDSCRRGGGS